MGMSWFSIANEEINLTIQKVMKENHGDLHAEGVTITAMIARSEEGPAIKVRGCEAAGCIRITKLMERTLGLGDAVMILDGERLEAWSSKRLQAVIDHELRHLMLAKNKKTGHIQRDDEGRPKLRIRPHDFEFGWFARTAELYGEESYEVSQAREIVAASWVQLLLPGLEIDPDPTGLAAYSGTPELKKGLSRREQIRALANDEDADDLDEETTPEFLSRQRKKIAAEREKIQSALDSAATSQRTAALSAKGTKPKRASKKASTVSA
jgi:hypothetical protein